VRLLNSLLPLVQAERRKVEKERGPSLKPFKDKIYWTLLPIGIIIGFFVIFVYPKKTIYGFLLIIVFWIVYYTWTYFDEKRNNKE
jgi:hypothetical protein